MKQKVKALARSQSPTRDRISGSPYWAFMWISPTGEMNKANLLLQTTRRVSPPVHEPRIVKQGNFDWGSFSAFEDGSIEVERNGVRQWFRTFSELKSSLSQTAESGRLPSGGLMDA
jgi:hypothetical protein